VTGAVVILAAGISWMAVREDGFPWNAVVWWVIWPAVIGWMVGGPRRALRVNSDHGPTDDR
jgi:hypothetical protein